MIFIDASALIAMIAGEEDADMLADLLAQERTRLVSPVAMWEATAGLCRSFGLSMDGSRQKVKSFMSALGIEVISLGEREYDLAIQAYADFGKVYDAKGGRFEHVRVAWDPENPLSGNNPLIHDLSIHESPAPAAACANA